MNLDLWTFDVGVEAATAQAYADECIRRVEQSWADGADVVLFPEFCWMGLERFTEKSRGLRGVSDLFWLELWPSIQSRLARPDKSAVLGTAPFFDEATGRLLNRSPILCESRAIHQDKLHLTPWENAFTRGDTLRLWHFRDITIAVIICLDIEVPELSVHLRNRSVDLILVPSATETILGVERVDRCASARAVELGCCVGVSHLVGRTESELIDDNIGRTAFYTPSQSAFKRQPREEEDVVITSGFHRQHCIVDVAALRKMRRMVGETNPSRLTANGGRAIGEIEIAFEPTGH